jgi:hypothetical protein
MRTPAAVVILRPDKTPSGENVAPPIVDIMYRPTNLGYQGPLGNLGPNLVDGGGFEKNRYPDYEPFFGRINHFGFDRKPIWGGATQPRCSPRPVQQLDPNRVWTHRFIVSRVANSSHYKKRGAYWYAA